MQHVTVEGLATAGGIQGWIADMTLAVLKFHKIELAVKWIHDFVFFRVPLPMITAASSKPSLKFDLSTILAITAPLGIPWHPISKKGHNFSPSFSYVSFNWDLPSRTVSLSNNKWLWLLDKVNSILLCPGLHHNQKQIASILGSLKHITIIYQQGCTHLPALSCFLAKFPNVHVLHHIVMSGVLGCSQVLLDHRGDFRSVVHLLISCCAKGGPGHWLQLVCCTYLWSGVWVFQISRAEARGWCRRMFNKVFLVLGVLGAGHGHSARCNTISFGVQCLGAEHPEGAWSVGSGNKSSRSCTQSWFTRCLTTRLEGPYILES